MHYLSNAMFWVSNGLLVPVVVALLYLFIRSLLMLGTLFGTWQTHRRRQDAYSKVISKESQFDVTALQSVLAKQRKGPFDLLLGTLLTSDRARRDLLIGEYDLAVEHRLGAAKILTKFGPILGLMGTLIPMGPALVGLSSGDIAGGFCHYRDRDVYLSCGLHCATYPAQLSPPRPYLVGLCKREARQRIIGS